VGKATVLLEQGQHESALAMFDALLAEDARDLEACEGRARTLDKLGRVGEAAAAFRRFVSLADAGAKLRVRVAQLWLDQH
jgi:Flp pilus assembly protein TadD